MKIGVIGAGKIAKTVSQTLAQMEEIELYAVAARELERAQSFAKELGYEKAYGSYEELVSDPKVELVYVTTPHSHHYEHMMLCLTHGKPVICEKAFTMNAKQAKEIRDYALAHHIYAAEAIWPRYMPSRKMIQEVVDSGIIGRVRAMTANLWYVIHEVPRIRDINLAGGALLDVGVYGINFVLTHFGDEIERIESSVMKLETGVDAMENITLHYKDGRMAVVTAGIFARSDRKGIFYGDKGYIVVENINNPNSLSVFDLQDRLLKHIDFPARISGYECEFEQAVAAIKAGECEASAMPLKDSVRMMEVMDAVRDQWGLVYPQEAE